jgi:hypothetical protein
MLGRRSKPLLSQSENSVLHLHTSEAIYKFPLFVLVIVETALIDSGETFEDSEYFSSLLIADL